MYVIINMIQTYDIYKHDIWQGLMELYSDIYGSNHYL